VTKPDPLRVAQDSVVIYAVLTVPTVTTEVDLTLG
jgi:hypothetical protein